MLLLAHSTCLGLFGPGLLAVHGKAISTDMISGIYYESHRRATPQAAEGEEPRILY